MPNSWYPKPKYNSNRSLYEKDFLSKRSKRYFSPRKGEFKLLRSKLFIQTMAVILIFFFSWGLFQFDGPVVNNIQEAVRAWFTKDTDLTPVFNAIKTIGFYGDSFERASFEVFAPTPSSSLEPAAIPVSGTVIKPYGWIMVQGQSSFHDGIVIEAPLNTPIKAAYAGTVLEVGENEKLGRYLVISHQEGLVTTYGYCSEILIKEDQIVEKSQIIGRIGRVGDSDMGQLYFETSRLGEPVNPMDLLEKNNHGI